MGTIVIRIGRKTTLNNVKEKLKEGEDKITIFQYGTINSTIITYLQNIYKHYGWQPLTFYYKPKRSFMLFKYKKFNRNENIFFDYFKYRIDNYQCPSLQR
jgi:hypothetical protein